MSAKSTKLARVVDELERTRAALVTLTSLDEAATLEEAIGATGALVESLYVRVTELERGLVPELEALRGAVRLHQRDTVRTLDVVRAAQRVFRILRGREAGETLPAAVDELERALAAYDAPPAEAHIPNVPPGVPGPLQAFDFDPEAP